MKIVTWNVNSLKVRLERLLAFLERHDPDIVCLQETKSVDEKFPEGAIEEAGYKSAFYGQKTYNGVAIVSKEKPDQVYKSFEDDVDDPQARFICATFGELSVASAYFPNGSEVTSDKFQYKLQWMKRLRSWLDLNVHPDDAFALCGDFNVAPFDDDASNIEQWRSSVLCTPEIRKALREIQDFGLEDTFRKYHPTGGVYSWWDYRQLAFPKNNGLRIDHIYATPALSETSISATVDRDERKGQSPSDHAPVIVEFDSGLRVC